MKRMKNLNKKQHHKTVEAYLCGVCGTPDDCMFKCDGSFDALQGGIIVASNPEPLKTIENPFISCTYI